jgi:hypothetical protein
MNETISWWDVFFILLETITHDLQTLISILDTSIDSKAHDSTIDFQWFLVLVIY